MHNRNTSNIPGDFKQNIAIVTQLPVCSQWVGETLLLLRRARVLTDGNPSGDKAAAGMWLDRPPQTD